MNSRERILKTLQEEKPDRIPVFLYEFDGFYDSWIHNYPKYEAILKYEGKKGKGVRSCILLFIAESDKIVPP